MDQVLLDEFFAECGLTEPFRVEVALRNEQASQIYVFQQPFLVVGRRAGSDLLLDHWLVSRRHAYLQLIEGRFFCVDLGSRTGTHGGDATERSGWLDPLRPIQIGPYLVRPEIPLLADRDYPPLPIVTWRLSPQNQATTVWTMNKGLALVGRSPACRIRISEPDVSRFHCGLVLTTSGVWVVDLLSQRPVIVNGRPVRFAQINPGDQLEIGHHILTADYDFSLIQAAQSHSSTNSPQGHAIEVASMESPDATRDQLPAIAVRPSSRDESWPTLPPFSLAEIDPTKPVDVTVTNLVQQFGVMQQQMFDQFHQTMMMMFEGFAALHRESAAGIREEFEEVRKLSQEIDSLRSETAKLAEATTFSLQQSAFQNADRHQPTSTSPGSFTKPKATTRPDPPPRVAPSLPDPHVDIHAQLCQRLNSIESERQSRWQKILAMINARSPVS